MTATPQTYRERPAAAPLASHLACVWVQRVAPGTGSYTHRTVPNGAIEVSCALGGLPRVHGPQTGPTEETLAPGAVVVGVRFRPGAAPSALGLPASELVDEIVGWDDLGGEGEALGERLAAAPSAEAAALELERTVLARVRLADGPDPLVAEAVRRLLPRGAGEVGSVSAALYISERQLRRRCLAAIGLAPKPLQRMLRFQRFLALSHAHGLAGSELAALAAEAGYADQPHLTRECMRLAGRSPRAVLRDAEEHCRGAHDHAASYAPLLAGGSAAA